jgi:hypothetical protein
MNNLTIFTIISIFLIICLAKIYIVCFRNNLEHLTMESDEAIQNLASLYNVDQLTIGKINSTGNMIAAGTVESEQLQTKNVNTNTVQTNTINAGKLQLGNKWIFSGVGDASANDTWLRLLQPGTATYYGGLATGQLYDASMGNTVKAYIDSQIQANRPSCNWNGWDVVCGGCTDNRDDYQMLCQNGKLVAMNVFNTSQWNYNGTNYPTG